MHPSTLLLPLLILASLTVDLALAHSPQSSGPEPIAIALVVSQVSAAVFALLLTPHTSWEPWLLLAGAVGIGSLMRGTHNVQQLLAELALVVLAATALVSVSRLCGARLVSTPTVIRSPPGFSIGELFRLTFVSSIGFACLAPAGLVGPQLFTLFALATLCATSALLPLLAALGRFDGRSQVVGLALLVALNLLLNVTLKTFYVRNGALVQLQIATFVCAVAYAWVYRCCGWRVTWGPSDELKLQRASIRLVVH